MTHYLNDDVLNKDILNKAIIELEHLMQIANVPSHHGIEHALAVLNHMNKALHENEYKINDRFFHLYEILALQLAALLHDADDRKYFDSSDNFNNAINIINLILPIDFDNKDFILTFTIESISYVSASKNGNDIPNRAIEYPELLWPRYCDRLEAIGKIGVQRTIDYNYEINEPLFTDDTPRAKTYDDVIQFATPDRFIKYKKSGGHSDSAIDHFYDKLLHICDFGNCYNIYLTEASLSRKQFLIDICIEFGKINEFPFYMLN